MWHKSMWGFNVTAQTFSYDNRPVVPLMDMTFEQWWFVSPQCSSIGVFVSLTLSGHSTITSTTRLTTVTILRCLQGP